MLAEERIYRIYDQILQYKVVKIDELALEYNVTPMTIRRDLDKLESNYPNVKRCHGGAILSIEVDSETDFTLKQAINITEKKLIAKRAFELIQAGDTIYLDAGTTTLELAKLIVERGVELNIVTNDIEIGRILEDSNCRVTLTGGTLQKSTGCLVGSFTDEFISKLRFKIAFMGATAINESFEILTPSIEKRTMKPLVLKNSGLSFLLVDSSKFNKNSIYLIYSLSDFTGVITNKEFTPAELQEAELKGIDFISI